MEAVPQDNVEHDNDTTSKEEADVIEMFTSNTFDLQLLLNTQLGQLDCHLVSCALCLDEVRDAITIVPDQPSTTHVLDEETDEVDKRAKHLNDFGLFFCQNSKNRVQLEANDPIIEDEVGLFYLLLIN
ncbi:unnamed protein product [Protopolystoma xenopodis]|uniref:Uncharacterized protein n=1 Tax=Protopolystoma xenopodis TaxID=117903 RepID=A0A3S5A9Z6_9PLAT|nr:unnamed protein product [Protopolystoma xenopodis]